MTIASLVAVILLLSWYYSIVVNLPATGSGTVSPSFTVEETEAQKAHHLPRATQLVHAKDLSKHQSYGVNIPREFTCVSWVWWLFPVTSTQHAEQGKFYIPKKRERNLFCLFASGGYILVLEHLPNLRKALGSRKHWGEKNHIFLEQGLSEDPPEWQHCC